MALNSVELTLLLLPLLAMWTTWTAPGAGATRVPGGCVCVREVKFLPWRSIANVSIVSDNPICRKHIIITLKRKRMVCLNPDSDQGKRLQKCWSKFTTNRDRKTACLRPAKRNKTKAH